MGMDFFTTDSVEHMHAKICVYGESGYGKTSLIGTLPDHSKVFIISAEKGTLSLKGFKIGGCIVNSLEDVEEAYEYFAKERDKGRFEWICLDSITDICEVVLSKELQRNNDPRKAYGNMQESMIRMIRKFRDLPRNVYVTAHIERLQGENGNFYHQPKCPGKNLGPKLPYYFDEVLCIVQKKDDNGVYHRFLQTSGDDVYVAKDRSGSLDKYEKFSLDAITEKIKG